MVALGDLWVTNKLACAQDASAKRGSRAEQKSMRHRLPRDASRTFTSIRKRTSRFQVARRLVDRSAK